MNSFEIYFHDLTEEAQERYLRFRSVSSPEDLNADLSPLAIIDLENEE